MKKAYLSTLLLVINNKVYKNYLSVRDFDFLNIYFTEICLKIEN